MEDILGTHVEIDNLLSEAATMEKVLSNVNKIIMDKSASSSGIVPYLPIDKLQGKGSK